MPRRTLAAVDGASTDAGTTDAGTTDAGATLLTTLQATRQATETPPGARLRYRQHQVRENVDAQKRDRKREAEEIGV